MYDVIVCGAGPAGATAAKYLAEEGVRTLLLEAAHFPRDKPCGGGLCPHIKTFPHVMDNAPRIVESECKRGLLISPNLKWTSTFATNNIVFYNTRRLVFDEFLARSAVASGAELREGETVQTIQIEEDRAVVITRNQRFVARAVIGASGAVDPVAQYIAHQQRLPEYHTVRSGLVLMEELEVGDQFIRQRYGNEHEAIVHLAGAPDGGYGWLFPKRDVVNIGYGGFQTIMKKRGPRKRFRHYFHWVREQGYLPPTAESNQSRGCLIPLGGPAKRTFTDRALIVGDAAGFVAPLTGEGIYYAMDSGRIAAKVLALGVKNNTFHAAFLQRYENDCLSRWGYHLQTQARFSGLLGRCPNLLTKMVAKDPVLLGMISEILQGVSGTPSRKRRIITRFLRDVLVFGLRN